MITKYGKVIISEESITIQDFHGEGDINAIEIVNWAKERLETVVDSGGFINGE